MKDDHVPLTKNPDDCDLVGWRGYCHSGEEMEDLYNLYVETDGWWNNDGNSTFTSMDFLALMTYYELQDMTADPLAVDYAWQIMARKMQWLCQRIGSSCSTGVIPANAIFNYVGTRESAGDRYTAYFIEGHNLHTYNEYTYSFATASELARKAIFNATDADSRLGALPDWGNASMFDGSPRQKDIPSAAVGWCQSCVLHSFPGSDPAYFMTSDQLNYFYGK